MPDPSRPRPMKPMKPMTWRTPVRLALRFGLPLVGAVIVGRCVVASIGGDIRHAGFALGLLLIAAGFTSRLVPGR